MTKMTYEDMIYFPTIRGSTDNAKENAFKFADECRNKEIDRFWTRGLYFWGFIAASFGAYIAVFNASLEVADKGGAKVPISFEAILSMSFTSKLALTILSFVCFIFCLSWLLVHKGSKFWQKNWETHIDYLENAYIGNIYKSHLDTNNKNEFSGCILSPKAYDYSVSKISLLCSMLITICSFCLFLFHSIILIFDCKLTSSVICYIQKNYISCMSAAKITTAAILLIFLILWFLLIFVRNTRGNEDDKNDRYETGHTYFRSCGETIEIIE